MSKEKDLKQMSLLEGSRASRSPLLEKEEEQKMIASSGMKLLELYPSKNASGLLARTLRGLLTSKTAWCSDRSTMTWKARVSKCKVLLFQLAVSVRGIKEKGSGSSAAMYPTPTSVQRPNEGNMRLMRKQVFQGSISREEASAMVGKDVFKAHGKVKMYPTPSASCQMDVVAPPETVKQNSVGWSVTRVGTGTKFGAKLNDVVNKVSTKAGGKLNPIFCEMLMGYPRNWTKIEPTELNHSETQSFHKSQGKSEKQSSRQKPMYRTPTAMDTGEDSFIYAAKILKGKINRNSNSRVQITLSTDVAIKFLKDNPHLIDQYDKPFMVRTKLPEKFEFINYLKQNTSIKELVKNTSIPKTKIEHWFRKDQCFSYPTIEDWNTIKPHLKEIKFDEELTFEIEQDWKNGEK